MGVAVGESERVSRMNDFHQADSPKEWVAVAFGALDISQLDGAAAELMLLPIYPLDEPLGLAAAPADLWRRLLDGPVLETDVTAEDRILLQEYAAVGIASTDPESPHRVRDLKPPWLQSPMHELVNALIVSLARSRGIELFVMKGPILHKQGLRRREHSGDVDIWVPERDIALLKSALAEWGWNEERDLWELYGLGHSVTLRPSIWGCEIDVHRRMAGISVDDMSAFETLRRWETSETFAGIQVPVLLPAANAVLMSLHSLRPEPGHEMGVAALQSAVAALRTGGSATVEVAESIGAFDALQSAFVQAFPEEQFREVFLTKFQQWGLHSARSRAQMYLWAARGLPLGKRMRFLWWAFWPSEKFVEGSDRFAGAGSDTMAKARIRRIARGVKELIGLR